MVRRRVKALLVAVGLCALFVIGAPAALAAYVEVGTFAGGGSGPGGSGSGNGELFNPGQADVNDSTGYLYVADTGNDRVQVFKPNATGGEYDSQASVPGAVGLAIDQSNGDVYVATATGVSKFEDDLTPVASGWSDPAVTGPLAVDPSTGDLLVADTAANLIRRFNSDGSADGTFAAERPIDLAADSTGDVLVITSTGDPIAECAATATVKRFSGAGVDEGPVGASLVAPGAIATDPDDDSLVIASRINQWNCGSESPLISFFSAAGTESESLSLPLPATQYAMVPGLAAQGEDSSRVYVVTRSPFNDEFGATRVTALEIPEPTAPQVVGQSALRGDVDATLRATIKAGGLATEYHFEYGTTAAYGDVTAPGTLPASFSSAGVSAAISGLEPGTTYHYRVVAENSIDAVEGPDRTFTTTASPACPNEALRAGAAAHLTECRAYELVTPMGSDADIRFVGGPVTPDGNAVCFQTEDQLLDADPNGIKTADQGFCSWRDASGWETKWVTGPDSPNPGAYTMGANVYHLSPDGQRAIFVTDGVLFGNDYIPAPDASHGGHMSAYMWEGGQTTWLSPAGPGVGDPPVYTGDLDTFGFQRRPLATSEDLTRGIFQSERQILPADENNKPDLYEWFPGGLRLVSSDSSGKAAGGTISLQDTFFDEHGEFPGNTFQIMAPTGTMAADGSRIFFEHGGAPLAGDATEAPEGTDPEINTASIQIQSVYMREGDEITLISPRRGSGPDVSVWFVGADVEGEVAYLESSQQLTAEAKEPGRAIYRYDVATDQLELVATELGGVKALSVSRDGSTVVYRERLSSDLVVDRDGVKATVGTFTAEDIESEQGAGSPREDQRMMRVSPDGRVIVFAAAGEFGGYGPGPVQVYRWETGEGLERISALEGSEPVEKASIGAYNTVIGPRSDFFHNHSNRANSGRVMSDDGSRVYFETPEALVNRDVNGVTDVYEWHNGEISLISTGTGAPALYHGSSADGRTVFISTFDRLLPEWDRNAKRDLYAVTPDGGFAPPPPPPSCQGEGCQPTQQQPPPVGTGKGDGGSNLERGLAAAKLTKGGKSIRVSVLVPGKVTAKLVGRLGKGGRLTVSRTSRTATAAGSLTLPVKLTRRAKERIAERGRLALTLVVTHAQSEQTLTRKVTLHD